MLHILRDPTSSFVTERGVSESEPAIFRKAVLEHMLYTCAKPPQDAGSVDLYRAMAHAVRDRLVQRWLDTQRTYRERGCKQVYYLSSEFLTGRSLGLCLLNLGLYEMAERIAAEHARNLDDVLESEGDPGLGNGGLGRLAACFMDSLATLNLPAVGYGIRYEYGIFEQAIENGQQIERRDPWLQYGNPWELPRYELAQTVRFFGRVVFRRAADGRLEADWVDTKSVVGLPYDSFIVGHDTNNVNTLRLWAARATHDFDLELFNRGDHVHALEEKVAVENISRVLYPNDTTMAGKELRLKQQYFFVACSIANVIHSLKASGGDVRDLAARAAVQLNDTHPSIAVAELMRVLVDEEHLDWDEAWEITQGTFAYTNHTLLPEALECWPVWLMQRLLPRHLLIIYEINQRFLRSVQRRWPGDVERLRRMSIIDERQERSVRMAHLATVGSHSINGVAKLHTQLIQDELLHDFYQLWPERFNNKTNGVTPRRWLLYANPGLARLITRRLGTSWLPCNVSQLARLAAQADSPDLLAALRQIKHENKRRLCSLARDLTGVELDPAAMLVVQVKRMHEYKRQLLTCLAVIAHYLRLKRDPGQEFTPRAYLFAGKAASSYAMAKLHIRLINDVAALVNGDPAMRGRLAVAFLPNYGVTLAQSIIPAADLSLQVSLAGTEASGTSNMKFALNGALTLGTLDGANVEIRDAVGPDNFFLFGLRVDEVRSLQPHYQPRTFIEQSPDLTATLQMLDGDLFSLGDRDRYQAIVQQLRGPDPYFVCADFEAYLAAEEAAARLYRRPDEWAKRALYNIAGASIFSSDDTIRAYAEEIWAIKPQPVEPLRAHRAPITREKAHVRNHPA